MNVEPVEVIVFVAGLLLQSIAEKLSNALALSDAAFVTDSFPVECVDSERFSKTPVQSAEPI